MSGAQEHLANDPTSELWGEHRSRYRFAAQFTRGKRVLDVATGAGFGLRMLRQAGACPIGVDYDPAALGEVRHMQPSARLLRADATRLPLATHSIQTVVSFETIEHVPDAAALLAEIRRVLVPGGHLVLSTPNRAFGPPERHTTNPYHIQEFTADELRALLTTGFDEVRLYSQRPAPSYRYVPFLMLGHDFGPAALAWKLLARLPFRLKNGLAVWLTGRPFYPGEDDYRFEPHFEPDQRQFGHALVAVAR